MFEQRPTNIFKVFVADPIPTGVTNIHARDVSGGFDQEIVGWCQATPEAIDEIISENELVLVGEDELISDPPIRYFPEIQWNENWQHYRKNFSGSLGFAGVVAPAVVLLGVGSSTAARTGGSSRQFPMSHFSDSPYKLLFLEIWVNPERNMTIFQFVDG